MSKKAVTIYLKEEELKQIKKLGEHCEPPASAPALITHWARTKLKELTE